MKQYLSLLIITASLFANDINAQFFKEIQRFDKPRSEEAQCFAADGSMDMDDSTLIVGAYCAKDNTGIERGQVEVFEKDTSNQWVRVQIIRAPILRNSPQFGVEVALYGNTLAISAEYERYDDQEANPLDRAGAVYIYQRDSTNTWIFNQKIVAPSRHEDAFFGSTTDVWKDTLVVGTEYYLKNIPGTNINSRGAAFMYTKDSNGTWQLSQSFFHPDPYRNPTNYGIQVAINHGIVAVSANEDAVDTGGVAPLEAAGAVYLYSVDSSGQFTLNDTLVSPVLRPYQKFGSSLSMSGTALVTGSLEDGLDYQGQNQRSYAGSAVIFNRTNTNIFNSGQKVTPSDRDPWDCFGWCVAANDQYVVITAPRDEHMPIVNDGGSAYIFKQDSTSDWIEAQKLVTLDRDPNQLTGRSIAISSSEIVIGTDFEGYVRNQQNVVVSKARGAFNTFVDCPENYLPFVHVEPDYIISELTRYDYQWLRCTPNGGYAVLPGEINYYFFVPDTGHYALAITHNDCSDTIGCFRYRNIGLEEVISHTFKVFPNPNHGSFSLDIPGDLHGSTLHVIDSKGVVVYTEEKVENIMHYDLDIPPGIYFLILRKEGEMLGYQRLFIQR